MKLKNIETNFSKYHAYLKKEGKNKSYYYDTMIYKLIKDNLTLLVHRPEDFPKEYLECDIINFDLEIELDNQSGITSYNNSYRGQKKTMTLWI
ncbi:hypothetical protein [Paracholeplasma manati]|uniref:hypothetical protein n=1 Tax=Paracholeplasma manati TaxID=591373 RepID=UPI002408302C|nr:hypothetical protein [Paracholeplasma manati]MDG0888308.1 hypothetical protein [Paracholeplasma manati]